MSYLNSPPPSFSFIHLPPIPEVISTGIHSHTSLPPHPPERTCSALLFSDLVKEKKMTFLFV
jgi:hypothetical protein